MTDQLLIKVLKIFDLKIDVMDKHAILKRHQNQYFKWREYKVNKNNLIKNLLDNNEKISIKILIG